MREVGTAADDDDNGDDDDDDDDDDHLSPCGPSRLHMFFQMMAT